LNSNCGRDYKPDMVGHISLAEDGAKCPDCRQPMNLEKGIEIGHLHQLGTYFSEAFNATFLDENGQAQFIHLGAYGIGIGRLFACIADAHRDKFGLSLPISMAPFPVGLILLKGDEKTTETAEAIYTELLNSGIEVLYDDRDVSAGVKFNDADLRGMPLRITVGDRALKKGGVEVKHRNSRQLFIVPVDQVVSKIKEAIKALEKELKKGLETVNRQKD
ncbi:MAG: proline--tRNA ligase, partial [candidate division Zixibacteria bacterium]|nr:proline--tRNA ligase [candidate division Zixibacteria bacterium]NIX56807.1 proline--tRNA ligase [candidate division Zixibacteria bacterium]